MPDSTVRPAEARAALVGSFMHAAAAVLVWPLLRDHVATGAILVTSVIEAAVAAVSLTLWVASRRSKSLPSEHLTSVAVYGSTLSIALLPWLDLDLVRATAPTNLLLITLVASTGLAATVCTALAHRRTLFLIMLGLISTSHALAVGTQSKWLLVAGIVIWTVGIGAATHVGFDRIRALEEGRRRSDDTARTDDLTGVLNRSPFMNALNRAATAEQSRTALALFDLDGFKAINDGFGHAAGDQVLTIVARRLGDSLPAGSQLGRLGGDEFAALIPCDDLDVATTLDALMSKVVRRIDLDGRRLYVDGSVGWTLLRPGVPSAEILAEADAAMYRSKRSATVATTGFDPNMAEELALALDQRHRFRAAVRAERIAFVVQPIVDAVTRELTAVEMLARWPTDDEPTVRPEEFSRLAGETGLAVELDRLALGAAAALLGSWRDDPSLGQVVVKVNISPAHVHNLALRASLDELIRTADRHRLGLEFVETQLIRLGERHHELLAELRDQGIGISIDDFGTGYSSFAYLRDLPANELKLDRSFITGIEHDEPNQNLVRAMVDVANIFGLRVVAEGVETSAAADFLATMGVASLQGFAVARPLAPELVSASDFGQPGTSHD